MPGHPIVRPGVFPAAQLDQDQAWVGTDGCAYKIQWLGEQDCLFAIDYCLANAKYLRDKWALATKQTYNDEQRPRQWMLQTPGIRALMRQLVELDAQGLIEATFEEASDAQI